MSTNLSRPPQIGPCVHTIRDEDLIPPLGWGKPGAEVRKCERPPGEAASFLIAERLVVSGDGEPLGRLSSTDALGPCPLSICIGSVAADLGAKGTAVGSDGLSS